MSKLLQRALALGILFVTPFVWGESAERLRVVTSIRPLTLLAQDLVAGLPVEVKTLLPANADPHNWAMRISDRQLLADADLVVWLGADFENFLAKPLGEHPPAAQLELGTLPSLHWPDQAGHGDHHDHHHDHHHAGRDMHLWLNPANAIEMQKALVVKLTASRPMWQAELQHRVRQQIAQLNQLQSDIQRRLSSHRTHGFIAYHDAYGHFVDAFGLHQLAAVNQSTEQRLSARALHQLQTQARNAHCLMVENRAKPEQRLANLLSLPIVTADGLALDPQLETFASFLTLIADAFEACLSSSARAADLSVTPS